MRIGIDAHVLGKNVGGVERFVRALVQGLPAATPEHEYIVFVTRAHFATLAQPASPGLRYVPLAVSQPLIERLVLLPWLAWRHRLDALIVQRIAPWFCGRCKLIVAVHDLTPIKFPTVYRGLSNRLVRLLTGGTIRRAALVLTPTETIRREVEDYATGRHPPVRAFYNGVDTGSFQAHDAAPADGGAPVAGTALHLLTVGAIEPRKNLETLLDALKALLDQDAAQTGAGQAGSGHPGPVHLTIVGGVRDQAYRARLDAMITRLGLGGQVRFAGFVREEDLAGLYRSASVFVSPSGDEGFNIPPLEAMACGVPVVCSDIPVHRELFDGAASFHATHSGSDLARQILALVAAPAARERQVAQGYATVARFDWASTVRNVAKALRLLKPET